MLQEEFVVYRLQSDEEIINQAWDEAETKLASEKNGRAIAVVIETSHKFGRKSNVAKTVLILPHSNVCEERVFSAIMKSKTSF